MSSWYRGFDIVVVVVAGDIHLMFMLVHRNIVCFLPLVYPYDRIHPWVDRGVGCDGRRIAMATWTIVVVDIVVGIERIIRR